MNVDPKTQIRRPWWIFVLVVTVLSGIGITLLLSVFNKSEPLSAISSGTPSLSSNDSKKPFAEHLPVPLLSYSYDGAYRITTLQLPPTHSTPSVPLVLSVERNPSPDRRGEGHYLTLDSVDSCFVLPSAPQKFIANRTAMSIQKIGQANGMSVYKALSPGYFRFEVLDNSGTPQWYDIFVSPVPSRHLDRMDTDWYLTQWNTVTKSNCGPSVAAMSVGWARGQEVSVVEIRTRLGWNGEGEVGMNELKDVLANFKVRSELIELTSVQDMFKVLERGHLLAVTYDMAGIELASNPTNDLRGQYYTDHGGHYLALKGYSLDKKYVIVYDPIPSDWEENRLRYGDGVSMIGRNRYYEATQLWKALRNTEALEISR